MRIGQLCQNGSYHDRYQGVCTVPDNILTQTVKDYPDPEVIKDYPDFEVVAPQDIEKRSFEIIRSELIKEFPPELEPIIVRVIHATADFDYAENLCFSEDVVNIIQKAILTGVHIITDTNMAMSGINKKKLAQHGGTISCFMADSDVAEEARRKGVTRAMVSMEKVTDLGGHPLIVIGNAPTALIRVCELYKEGVLSPSAVIGVPVGFVNVEASKELLTFSGLPYIVARGRKGGSTVAAAIVNALLYGIES